MRDDEFVLEFDWEWSWWDRTKNEKKRGLKTAYLNEWVNLKHQSIVLLFCSGYSCSHCASAVVKRRTLNARLKRARSSYFSSMSSGKNSGTIWSVSATDEFGVCCGGWATTRLDSRGFPEDPWQEVCPLGVERVTQGWMRTSSVVNRVVGSLRSKQRMRHLARELILSGSVNWPRRILANRPVCSWPWNGYLKSKESPLNQLKKLIFWQDSPSN